MISLQAGSKSLQSKIKDKNFRVMILKRRQIVFVLMIAVVVSAGYMNYRYQNGSEKQVYGVLDSTENVRRIGETRLVSVETKDPFEEARFNKTKARDERLDLLDDVLETGDDEEKKNAQNQKLELGKMIEQESLTENVLKSKGYEQVMVTVTEKGATVTVLSSEGLKVSDSARITEAVSTETGIEAEKVKIIEMKP